MVPFNLLIAGALLRSVRQLTETERERTVKCERDRSAAGSPTLSGSGLESGGDKLKNELATNTHRRQPTTALH